MPIYFRTIFLCCLVLLGNAFTVLAQDTTSTQLPVDSSQVDVRLADSATLQEITSDPVFEYNEVAQNPETFWGRFQRWLWQNIFGLLDNRWTSLIIKIAFFATFGIVFVSLINQLLGGNIGCAFKKRDSGMIHPAMGKKNHSQSQNLEQQVSEAVASQRFSDAVRYLYLQALRDLNERNLIHFKPEKTNRDYLNELEQHPSSGLFHRLTLYYEYVEYGDFTVEQSTYEKVKTIYDQFRKAFGQ